MRRVEEADLMGNCRLDRTFAESVLRRYFPTWVPELSCIRLVPEPIIVHRVLTIRGHRSLRPTPMLVQPLHSGRPI